MKHDSANGDAVWVFSLKGQLGPLWPPPPPQSVAGPAGPVAEGVNTIKIGDNNVEYAYWPGRTRAKAGTAVTFTNVGDVPHTATAGSVANARPNSFTDVFFFSVETVATVGYGAMYPSTLYGHVVVTIEIICGLGFTAILTGLTFVRFSRPRAKLVFAPNPVVAMHDGKPTLMVRIGNGRAAVLTDGAAKLNIFFLDTTPEGKRFRRAQELRLERAHIPIFTIFWTLMHVLDERSPLHGYDAARATETDARVFVTLEARDPTLASVVHDVRYYAPQDICFGMRYADIVSEGRDGTQVADLSRIGALEPDVEDRQEPGWTEREENE